VAQPESAATATAISKTPRRFRFSCLFSPVVILFPQGYAKESRAAELHWTAPAVPLYCVNITPWGGQAPVMTKPSDSDEAADAAAASVEQYLVKDPERFALNLARMVEQAGKAAAAWAEPREKGEVRDTVAEPVADMVKTFSKLTEYWLSDPKRALDAQTR